MNEWSELEKILKERKVSEKDANLLKDFLNYFDFHKRQTLMGVFLGFPDKIPFFLEILNAKKNLGLNFDKNLASDIIEKEKKLTRELIDEINQENEN